MPTEGERLATVEAEVRELRRDVAELRTTRKEDHHRLRTAESAVQKMVDAQREARQSEQRQYRRMGNKIALGGVAVAAAMVVLSIVTILIH